VATYTAQIILRSTNGPRLLVVPVTLTIEGAACAASNGGRLIGVDRGRRWRIAIGIVTSRRRQMIERFELVELRRRNMYRFVCT
jgi:hypothetical protein